MSAFFHLANGVYLFLFSAGVGYFLGASLLGARHMHRQGVRLGEPASLGFGRPFARGVPDGWHVYFLVPCLNEAEVIANTVRGLLDPSARSRIVVIDDDSDDDTAAVARAAGGDQVTVVSRSLPEARKGKGAALNAGYSHIRAEATRLGLDPARVIVAVMDADGRLSDGAMAEVLALFEDPEIGAVQMAVRLRNRSKNLLLRLQDDQFWTFSALTQLARTSTGTVSLGGNGQFARMSALDEIEPTPWSASLTEDLELGLDLVLRGWTLTATPAAAVDQQGISRLRPLLRQRTRWYQGQMSAIARLPEILQSPRLGHGASIELTMYLLVPWLFTLAWSVVYHVVIVELVVVGLPSQLFAGGPLSEAIAAFLWYLLVCWPALVNIVIARRRDPTLAWWRAAVIAHCAIVTNYLWYYCAWRALYRMIRGQTGWAKTAREHEVATGQPELIPAGRHRVVEPEPVPAGRHRDDEPVPAGRHRDDEPVPAGRHRDGLPEVAAPTARELVPLQAHSTVPGRRSAGVGPELAPAVARSTSRPAVPPASNARRPSHPRRGAWIAGGVVGAIMWLRMFIPVPIGMADNGDGPRLMCQVGVSPIVPHGTKLYDAFALFNYGATPSSGSACAGYPSSTVFLMRFDTWVSHLLGLHATLDLRVSMALYCVIVAAAAVALCTLVGHGWRRQGTAAAVLLLIAGDATFADYMGSPFTETAGIMALVVLPIAAVFAARSGPVWARCAGLVAFTASAAVLVSAKVETVTIAVPVLAFLAWLALRGQRGFRSSPIARWRARIALAMACLLSAGAVVVPAVATYEHNPPQFAVINPTEVIFGGILRYSSDPTAALREMGLPAEFAKYAGQTWWSSDPPQKDPLFSAYQQKMTYGTIAAYLAHHPGVAVDIANDGAQQFLDARPTYLGNYSPGYAKPGAVEHRISVLSAVMQYVAWTGLVGFLLLTLIAGLLAAWLARRRRRGSAAQSFAVVSLLCNAICLTQYVTATFGEAVETTKHLVFAVLAALLCGGLLLCAAITRDRNQEATPAAAQPEPAQHPAVPAVHRVHQHA